MFGDSTSTVLHVYESVHAEDEKLRRECSGCLVFKGELLFLELLFV